MFKSSLFSNVKPQEPVELFELAKAFQLDSSPNKVNLSIGAYRSEEGKCWVIPVVRKVEKQLAAEETLNHEYLGQIGLESFTNAAIRFILGHDSPAIRDERVLGIQSLSGTGALRIGAELLTKCMNYKVIYISDPCWPSHHIVFPCAGFQEICRYRYWDPPTRSLHFKGMLQDLREAPEGSIILLHVCGHNPTGVDPTLAQWKQIADVMEERHHFPFFDCAYQGFASGNWEEDSWPVRYFVSRGFELFCAQSFAKNFGLYGERVGNLLIVFKDISAINNVRAQLTYLIRGNYSNPPAYGVRVVEMILNDEKLFTEWKLNVKTMADRIKEMRFSLREKLEELDNDGTWNHLTDHIGMYSFSGITGVQTDYLRSRYHIYMPRIGRMNMSGLNHKNIDYVAKAISDVVTTYHNNC